MSPKTRMLLTAATIGLIVSFMFGLTLGSIIWFRDNPSIAEANAAIDENMNLSEDVAVEVSQMVAVGAAIDFIFKYHVIHPTINVCGNNFWLFAGLWWYKSGI